MSSVYGIYTNSSMPDTIGLSIWNNIYGHNVCEKAIDSSLFIGCNLSAFSSHPRSDTPLLFQDNYIAAIDCVIYNRSEICSAINASETISDEQLLFNYLIKNGVAALKNINGDYAGAVYNKETKILTLFRDHTGIRPLFYYFDGTYVVFSTDIRGITAIRELPVSVNEEWAYKCITGSISINAVTTEYKNIFRVESGTFINFQSESDCITRAITNYWKPGAKKISLSSAKKYQKKMRELISDSIKLRLDAYPGKIGAELSGGLDSSVIDILINRFGREGVYFSWSQSPDARPVTENGDERLNIEEICKQEGITCHYTSDSSKKYIEDLQKVSIERGFDNDAYQLYHLRFSLPPHINTLPVLSTLLCVKENGASVVFTGHGGDEGVSHRGNVYELFYHHEYYHYFRNLWSQTHGQKHRILKTVKSFRDNMNYAKNTLLRPFTSRFVADSLVSESLQKKAADFTFEPLYFAYDCVKYVAQGTSITRPENTALLSTYSDGLYVFPYLDYRVLDYALSIPRHNFMKNSISRYIYREAFKDILPKRIYTHRLKEDISNRPLKKEKSEWFPSFEEDRRRLVKAFNRTFWDGILDFEKLEKWAESGMPSVENRDIEDFKYTTLCMLLMAQSSYEGSQLAVERHNSKNKS